MGIETAPKVLVFTDLHVTEPGRKIIGLDPAERFRRAFAHALSNHPDAAHVVITGDLAHTGAEAEYRRLADILDGAPVPVTLIPGNHDRREALWSVFPDAPRTEDGYMQGTVRLGDHTLLFLDTLDGPPYRDGHHAGRLCPARMHWADRAIAEAPGPVVIFMHHPPYAVGFRGMDDIRLANDEAFLAMLARHGPGKVAHVLSGHVHRTISGNVGGISVSLLKSTCHQMPMLLGAAGSGHSVAEPGAYGIVLLGPRSVIVHSEDFDVAGAQPIGDHTLD